MKDKTIKGFVIWTRDTTPLEDGQCVVHRAKVDAMDLLRNLYEDWEDQVWRMAPVSMTATAPVKVKKASKKKGKKNAAQPVSK